MNRNAQHFTAGLRYAGVYNVHNYSSRMKIRSVHHGPNRMGPSYPFGRVGLVVATFLR